jgi:hypothetical protein
MKDIDTHMLLYSEKMINKNTARHLYPNFVQIFFIVHLYRVTQPVHLETLNEKP